MSKIRLLVISDLHTTINNNFSDDSRLNFSDGKSEFGDGIINFLKSLDLEFDAILCAGDITNKACKQSFSAGWDYVNSIQKSLNIPRLFTVPGNHDHNSRVSDDYSPIHNLQFYKPSFPLSSHEKNTHFWAWNWCHLEEDKYNVVLLNSSAYHGYGDEFKHGRVALEVVDQIKEHMSHNNTREKIFNILLCHHHPEKMEYIDHNYDTEQMEGGKYLIDKLQDIDKGPWLIIHGHKHFANLSYASSNNNCPAIVLSAGSLSAKLYPSIKDRTSNQLYIIEVDINKTDLEGKLFGTVLTYEWDMVSGWKPSRSEHLPARGGFGCADTPKSLAQQIIKKFDEKENIQFIDSNDITEIQSKIDNLPPIDFRRLVQKLEEAGFSLSIDQNKIIEVGK
ncbi:metallophosphoesterase [Aeromonas dhakensis]|uniref:metallophosphoesterase family protein n=1 Tax=Aeromonas dhakensis TaxID=196024 RepID=UPI00227C3630|nr:metallophosphoesterase [Aeromonas dhakensis]WAF98926.1 metallophosphoesterase [Aeromonas dhakensis]